MCVGVCVKLHIALCASDGNNSTLTHTLVRSFVRSFARLIRLQSELILINCVASPISIKSPRDYVGGTRLTVLLPVLKTSSLRHDLEHNEA